MKSSYNKIHLSYKQQVQLLASRNLQIVNTAFAEKKLQHLNYYRLSSYFYPFYDDEQSFKNETHFEDVLKLYYFDKELRHLVFYAIEKIEIYIRTQIAHVISKNNGVFGYVDGFVFHSSQYHEKIMENIVNETSRSKEKFVRDFYKKYDEKYLPVWAMVEIISFNTLSRIFASLKEKYRQEIVEQLQVKPFVFQRWLHTLTYIRNICAHHSRLWNIDLAIEPMKPKNQKKIFQQLDNKKLFFVLVMIEFLLLKIDDEELDFTDELNKLFLKYPDVDKKAMGFTETWQNLEIWRLNDE